MEYPDIVNKLVGPIKPRGESNYDQKAYDNLQEMCMLVAELLDQIHDVAKLKDWHEYSIKHCGQFAFDFIKNQTKYYQETIINA